VSRRPPIAGWPERDRAAWEKGVEPAGLFESGGAGAGWSAASRFKTAGGYNSWLLWLAEKGLLDADANPADRVTRERVAAYAAELRGKLAPYTVLCRVQELHDSLRAMAPERDWDWLAQIYRSLRAQVRPMRDKFSRVKPIDELAALGERLMDEAETTVGWSARRRAVGFRDGLMISVLAYRPVRLKNFASMRLGHHLTKVGGCWQILFAADETKSHVPYEAIVPSALVARLERYLEVHRPVLLRGECVGGATKGTPTAERTAKAPINPGLDALWVSETGTHLVSEVIQRRIFDHTRQEFGRGISPHFFRDAAATSIAVENPRHVGDASLVLGHAGQRMTEKHYNHARSLEASRRQAETLTQLRRSLNNDRKG
jgi:integrase